MMNEESFLVYICNLIIPIMGIVDYSGSFRVYCILILFGIGLAELYSNFSQPAYYNRTTSILAIVLICIKLGVFVTVLLNYFFDKGENVYTLIYSGLFIFVLIASSQMYYQMINFNILS